MEAVTLQLDKERHAKLTLGGMKAFQQKTGKSLLKGFNVAELDEGDIIALVWACLIWEDPTLTLEACGFMLDMEAVNSVTSAFTSMGSSPPNAESRPNGSTSGPSGGMTSDLMKGTSGV